MRTRRASPSDPASAGCVDPPPRLLAPGVVVGYGRRRAGLELVEGARGCTSEQRGQALPGYRRARAARADEQRHVDRRARRAEQQRGRAAARRRAARPRPRRWWPRRPSRACTPSTRRRPTWLRRWASRRSHGHGAGGEHAPRWPRSRGSTRVADRLAGVAVGGVERRDGGAVRDGPGAADPLGLPRAARRLHHPGRRRGRRRGTTTSTGGPRRRGRCRPGRGARAGRR